MMFADSLTVEVNVKDMLNTLRTNREQHGVMVVEARKGYIDQARKALSKRLDQLQSGKLCALRFDLQPPGDHTKVYDVAIRTLELHTEDTIELSGAQVRTFVMDEWDWTSHFLVSNAGYSTNIFRIATEKGHIE